MPSNEHKTSLIVEAKGRGLKEQQREAEKLRQALSPERLAKGLNQMDEVLAKNIRRTSKLGKELASIGRALKVFEGAVSKVDRLAESLKKSKNEASQLNREASKGAFSQGFLQQVGFGPFLQRGPGMRRQAAGMMAGQMFRAPFAGTAGLTQGIANIPGVGLMAGPMQAALQGASQFRNIQRLQMQIAASGGGLGAANAAARGASSAIMAERFQPRVFRSGVDAFEGLTPAQRARTHAPSGYLTRAQAGAAAGADPFVRQFMGLGSGGAESADQAFRSQSAAFRARERERFQDEEARRRASFQSDRDARAGSAGRAARDRTLFGRSTFGGAQSMAGIGSSLGAMNVEQTLQLQRQILEQGGGSASGAFQNRALSSAIAAQTLFGVSPGVSGSLLGAQRQGGLQGLGSGGRSGDALSRSIALAAAQGFEGSEINRHLQTMAAGIEQFRQTGIPFAGESISRLSVGIQRASGLGAARSGQVGAGIVQTAQKIAQQGGPRSPLEFQMLQQLGGFGGRGGGMADMMTSLERLRSGGGPGGFSTDELRGLFKGIGGKSMGRGGRDQAATSNYILQRSIVDMGGGMVDLQAIDALRRELAGQAPNSAQSDRILQAQSQRIRASAVAAQKGAGSGAGGLERFARARTGALAGSAVSEAQITNERIAKSAQVVGSLDKLERSQNKLIETVGRLNKEMDAITGFMLEATSLLPELVDRMRELVMNGPVAAIRGP